MKNYPFYRGFTLLELLVAIAMLAILVALAAPSMRPFLDSRRIEGVQKNLLRDFALARTEAMSRGKPVAVCQSDSVNGGASALTCDNSATDWHQGWLVFVDDGAGTGTVGDGILNGGEELLKTHVISGSNPLAVIARRAEGNNRANLTAVLFDYLGRTSVRVGANVVNTQAIVKVCSNDDLNSSAITARAVLLDKSGRISSSVDSDGNGIHNERFVNDDGTLQQREIVCDFSS